MRVALQIIFKVGTKLRTDFGGKNSVSKVAYVKESVMLMWYEGFYCILYTTFKSITVSTLYPKQQNVTVKFANVSRFKKRTPIIIYN